jgi:hypothetical protein
VQGCEEDEEERGTAKMYQYIGLNLFATKGRLDAKAVERIVKP